MHVRLEWFEEVESHLKCGCLQDFLFSRIFLYFNLDVLIIYVKRIAFALYIRWLRQKTWQMACGSDCSKTRGCELPWKVMSLGFSAVVSSTVVVRLGELITLSVRSDREPAHIWHTLPLDGGRCGHYSLMCTTHIFKCRNKTWFIKKNKNKK